MNRGDHRINDSDSAIAIGEATFYPQRYEVRMGSRQVQLTPAERELLCMLVRRQGMIVSHERVLEQCQTTYGEISLRSVSRRVQRLRRKLGAAGRHLVCIPGAGYMLDISNDIDTP